MDAPQSGEGIGSNEAMDGANISGSSDDAGFTSFLQTLDTPRVEEGLTLRRVNGNNNGAEEAAAQSSSDDVKDPPTTSRRRSSSSSINPFVNGTTADRRLSFVRTTRITSGGVTFHTTTGGDGIIDGVHHEAITLPHSTHTFLFTEDVFSVAFVFAVLILVISILCLVLAMIDSLGEGNTDNFLGVPANVKWQVHLAGYLSIVIAVLMEEEIPTALYLLRVITKYMVESNGLSYGKFVVAAMFRLVIGYLFLVNVFMVIMRSEGVLDMFYDMLALQFVSMVDDIAFRLAQLDILGKHLRNASSSAVFQTEFERRPFAFRRKMTIFTKVVFSLNFILMLAGIIVLRGFQTSGQYQCQTVTVTFGDDVWENAWVKLPGGDPQSMVLVYSYFNGRYIKNGTRSGRPVYKELRKSESTHFASKTGAEIWYCMEEDAWVFTHQDIKKTETDSSSCPWLLRSPDTDAFDLLDVPGPWQIWVGVIDHGATMSVSCDQCTSDIGCNLNGNCVEGICKCTNPLYQGTHCELERPCPHIMGEFSNSTWSITLNESCDPLYEYGRPIFVLDKGSTIDFLDIPIAVDEQLALIYTGSRWVSSVKSSIKKTHKIQADFHAFWDKAFFDGTAFKSDPTKGSSPVGTDFYRIGEESGDQYGPFGLLYPLQDPPGRGLFRCEKGVTMLDEIAMCKNRRKTGNSTAPFN